MKIGFIVRKFGKFSQDFEQLLRKVYSASKVKKRGALLQDLARYFVRLRIKNIDKVYSVSKAQGECSVTILAI